MPTQQLIAAHRKAQHAAKAVLCELADRIGPDDTEQSIAACAVSALEKHGIRETWYHDCPALVLLGSRSCHSASGRDYRPALEPVGDTNLVTIDLSPSCEGHWGDFARSLPVEQGRVTFAPTDPELSAGIDFVRNLQSAMRQFVTPDATFHDLAVWTAEQLEAHDFTNLDFRGNVGHSLAQRREDRLYVERGNRRTLGEAGFFTFEPHVRAREGRWGFKFEDVFFFDESGALESL